MKLPRRLCILVARKALPRYLQFSFRGFVFVPCSLTFISPAKETFSSIITIQSNGHLISRTLPEFSSYSRTQHATLWVDSQNLCTLFFYSSPQSMEVMGTTSIISIYILVLWITLDKKYLAQNAEQIRSECVASRFSSSQVVSGRVL